MRVAIARFLELLSAMGLAIVALGCGLLVSVDTPFPEIPPDDAEVSPPLDNASLDMLAKTRRKVAAGGLHSCALYKDGKLYCWGAADRGQLGAGAVGPRTSATPLAVAFPAATAAVVDVCAGNSHTCAVTSDKKMWCWGDDSRGRLGVDTADSTKPAALAADDWWVTACGSNFSCGLSDEGKLYCWGAADGGRLGLGEEAEDQFEPARIGEAYWIGIDAGGAGACGVRSDGTLWCWGDGSTLGRPSVSTPRQIGTAKDWSEVRVGDGAMCATKQDGEVHCWNATAQEVFLTVRPDARSPRLDLGGNHGCGIANGGANSKQLSCWGRNGLGQLGTDTNVDAVEPTPSVQEGGAPVVATDVAAGFEHTCVFDSGNQQAPVQCAGSNSSQQLGLGGAGGSMSQARVFKKVAFP